jgi:hypothetical protein
MRMSGFQSVGHTLYLSPPAGRGRIAPAIRVRGALRERGDDCFNHPTHIAKHIVVPKSQDPVIMISKPFVTGNITRVVSVLPSIDFNSETTFAANKIDGVRTDRFLPNEHVSIQPARPQPKPKRGLGLCGVSPQTPGTLGRHLSGSAHAATPPHPDCTGRCFRIAEAIRPLPARGERSAPRASK